MEGTQETDIEKLPSVPGLRIYRGERKGDSSSVFMESVCTHNVGPSVYVCNAKTIRRMRFVNKTNYNKGFHPRDDFFEGLRAR